uniref:Aminoglycoside phosphotransferase domain-containing protein n=1 Tax=candidate division WOR-3 bacterium TaxID=2052148 RepID=A0A7V1EIZ4_UNCW3
MYEKQNNSDVLSEYEIIEAINTGGSDRKFFRVKKGNTTYILIEDPNIDQYVKILNHLHQRGVGVPELIMTKGNRVIIEDLGRDSLYDFMRNKKYNWQRFYELAIEELVKLQIDGYKDAPVNLYYDEDHIKWEQDYFKEFFLQQLCKIPEDRLKETEDDFKILIKDMVGGIKPIANFLMHRDYQSQNIYIKNNKIRIIDFQSARIGPLTYDLASLLRDAYVDIDERTEEYLIFYYLDCLKKRGIEIPKEKFLRIYNLTAIQRNMQALGAFVNLSLNKNKTQFKKFIPRGIRLLNAELKRSNFLRIYDLTSTIEQLFNCSDAQLPE